MNEARLAIATVAIALVLGGTGCMTASRVSTPRAGASSSPDAWLAETDVAKLQADMEAGEIDSTGLVRASLARIAALDDAGPRLGAVLEIAPDAVDEARARDTERAAGRVRGPLHGIPVLLKGNIDIAGMENNAGSPALAGNVPGEDAPLVARLRAAGAVVLGTANLSEWANFRSARSSSGWSSIGRQTRNPHVLDRNPCGSSSGSAVAVAAGLAVAAIGTETDGSVVCPAGQNGVVGVKPTVGLVSRDGIIPIAHSQDTAGPMGRTVRDAALVLQAIAARDTDDPATVGFPEPLPDYTGPLVENVRLDGVRLGVWREHYGAGADPDVELCLAKAIAALESLGAEIVDPVDLGDLDPLGDAEGEVLYTEFKHDIASYLAAHGTPNGMATLDDLMAFNVEHAAVVMPYFGQERFERSRGQGGLDDPEYVEALAESKRISQEAIDGALARHGLAAIVAPTNSPAWPIDLVNGDHYLLSSSQLPAVSGYPSVTVPMCFVHELPVGISIFGGAYTEAELLRVAHAFEGATNARRAPAFLRTLELD